MAAALRDSRNFIVLAALPAPTFVPDKYQHQIEKIKTEGKNEIKEMQSMIKRILQAIASQ